MRHNSLLAVYHQAHINLCPLHVFRRFILKSCGSLQSELWSRRRRICHHSIGSNNYEVRNFWRKEKYYSTNVVHPRTSIAIWCNLSSITDQKSARSLWTRCFGSAKVSTQTSSNKSTSQRKPGGSTARDTKSGTSQCRAGSKRPCRWAMAKAVVKDMELRISLSQDWKLGYSFSMTVISLSFMQRRCKLKPSGKNARPF